MGRSEQGDTGITDAATGTVVVDISVSVDGYVAAPGTDARHGLGVGGEVLHEWVWAEQRSSDADTGILDEAVTRTGAVVLGRRTFEFVDGPHGWNDDIGYGADRQGTEAPPAFVLTGSPPEAVRLADRFSFVTDGPHEALERARAAAGGKDVVVMGGGRTASSVLLAGLADELTLHLVPVVLGGGTPLFPGPGTTVFRRLERVRSVSTPAAEHLTYRVLPTPAD
ncbi:dihydrofolate reductase family protein [Saccharomonospora halophila]|uniref:dihydrofolate reductase family protein n=1 Tax=Saccharomonospora halophila TaxID=129922 RepID=UPI0003729305|nr:dihydrofolate reductase family protein [Saccharomonospora halophila]